MGRPPRVFKILAGTAETPLSMPTPTLSVTKPSAIILGFDCITGLQTGRVLARMGVEVTAIVRQPQHFSTTSRCVHRIICGSVESPDFVDRLIGLATKDRPVLIPATDVAVDFLARHAQALAPHFRSAITRPEIIDRILSKTAFAEAAKTHALPIPKTERLEHSSDLLRISEHLAPPFVLKPDLKTERWDRETGVKILEASNIGALEEIYQRYRSTSPRFVVQEWIEGGDEAMYSYYAFIGRDGRCVADCLAHKLRQWPRLTGSGTLAEQANDPELIEIGRNALTRLEHRGFASVQMKRDARTGRSAIIEINVGRPAMGSFLAEAAGIEMMQLAYEDLAGLPPRAQPEPKIPGARWVSWKRDIRAALKGWQSGELSALDYLRSLRGIRRAAVWSLRDPLPFIVDLLRSPRKLIARKPALAPPVAPAPPTSTS